MKCPECGEHRTDVVNQILLISFLITFFCFGWQVRHTSFIIDMIGDYQITAVIIFIIEIGSIAFFILACLILWTDDRY